MATPHATASSSTSLLKLATDQKVSLLFAIRPDSGQDRPLLGTQAVSTVDQQLAQYISRFQPLPRALLDVIGHVPDQSPWCRITLRLANQVRFFHPDAWALWNRYLPDVLDVLYQASQTAEPEALPFLPGPQQVPIAELTVPDEYQRDLRENYAKSIAKSWDAYANNPIVVNRRRDGTLVIVDGQHRWRAAQILQHQQIFAQVFRVIITPEREATIHKIHGTAHKNLTPFERWKTDLASGDPETLAIQAILTQHEFLLSHKGKHVQSGQIAAITSLRAIFRKDQGVTLSQILKIVNAAWSDEGRLLYQALLEGLAKFLQTFSTHPNYHELHLIKRLASVDPQTLSVRSRNDSTAQRLHLDIATAYAIGRLYNYKRTDSNRLPLALLES